MSSYFTLSRVCRPVSDSSTIFILLETWLGYPGKVKEVLRRHERVADTAVIGRADPLHTEEVVAFIAPRSSALDQEALAIELRGLCREHLAPYEVPSKFEFTDQIPRSALGKVLKKELRRLLGAAPMPGEPVAERQAA